jgi:hypothetical protein
VLAAMAALTLVGCGEGAKTATVTAPTGAQTPPNASTNAGSARSQNEQVISQAEHANDNQAQLGEAAIRQMLTQKLGINNEEDFNLSHHIAPGETGGDCYVKLGAEAVNFESQSENILRSPNGMDVVFVQSNTTTPLVRCLKAVRTALGW